MFPANRLAPLLLGHLSRQELAQLPHLDEYQLLYPIGRGGMGCVYRAQDTLLDRPVAIKFLSTATASLQVRERFVLEARAIARLSHPNVVTVYRVGEIHGQPYLISEYVRGRTLEKLPKPLPSPRVLEIAIGLCRGLCAAHRRGVLHRDIKPGNAILADDGVVKLLDFGLAKLFEAEPRPGLSGSGLPPLSIPPLPVAAKTVPPEPSDLNLAFDQTMTPELGKLGDLSDLGDHLNETALVAGGPVPMTPFDDSPVDLTRAGARLGTPLYMAPEMWRGEPATALVDIYSLGALLYELCGGRPPHVETTVEDLGRLVQAQEAPPLASLGVEVDPLLAEVIERCLRRDPAARFPSADALCQELEAIHSPPQAASIAGNPYRGLYPFESEHRALFFGRSVEARTILERLRSEPMVLVAGDSGVGKSSLCRAGVLAAVAAGALGTEREFTAISLLPGKRPLLALADALAPLLESSPETLCELLRVAPAELIHRLHKKQGHTKGLLLFIDQLEELLTLSDPQEATALSVALGSMTAQSPGLRVLLTARGDFLTRLTALPGLGSELNRVVYILGALTRDGLREAIVGPARVLHVRFESNALINELVDSTLDAEGGLPLLQFALAELWEARDHDEKVITRAALTAIGGVSGALARHAERLLAELSPAQRRAAQRILLQLVTAQGLRVRRTGPELCGSDPLDRQILDGLVRGRLLSVRQTDEESTYEIAHEALVRGWPTLQKWLDSEVDRRAVHERLAAAAAEWRRLERAAELLWSERQLSELDSYGFSDEDLSSAEQEFVAAARQRIGGIERRKKNVRAALLVIPLFLALFALQNYDARQQRKLAEEERRMGEKLARAELGARAVSLAQLPGREMPALVASLQAIVGSWQAQEPPPPSALEALSEAIEAAQRSLPLRGHTGQVTVVRFSPDGRHLLTAGEDHSARVWDVESGQFLQSLDGHKAPIEGAAFSPDGALVATTAKDYSARIWELSSGLMRAKLEHSGEVKTAFFSPDGKRLLTVSQMNRPSQVTAWLWEVKTSKLIKQLAGCSASGDVGAFSPDGQRFVLGQNDGSLRIYDAKTGEVQAGFRLPLADHLTAGELLVAGYSPDGSSIYAWSGFGTKIWLFDAASGRLRSTLHDGQTAIGGVIFSPDGRYLLAGSLDGQATLWDARSGMLRVRLQGHTMAIVTAAFSPDSQRLITAGDEHVALIWEIPSGQLLSQLRGHSDTIVAARFSPDGQTIATSSRDNSARLWRPRGGQHLMQLLGHTNTVVAAVYAPDGQHIATASQDRTARIWDSASGHEQTRLEHPQMVASVAFSPDGRSLATSTNNGAAWVWDWQIAERRLVVPEQTGGLGSANPVFSPDGERLATIGNDHMLRIWEWRSGRLLRTLRGHNTAPSNVVFSPDGQRLASADFAGVVRIWDARSGEALLQSAGAPGRTAFVAFSPDGARIVAAGVETRVGDVKTGTPLLKLSGHLDATVSALFSRDGRRIITQGQDQSVRVFDAANGLPLHVLHIEDGTYAELSPDGQRILVVHSSGNRAALYPATTEALFHKACDLLSHQPEWLQVRASCLSPPHALLPQVSRPQSSE